jgi:hypothetical protein
VAAVFVALHVLQRVVAGEGGDLGSSQHWLAALALNLMGYCTVFLPGFVVIRYVRKYNYLETAGITRLSTAIRDNHLI